MNFKRGVLKEIVKYQQVMDGVASLDASQRTFMVRFGRRIRILWTKGMDIRLEVVLQR